MCGTIEKELGKAAIKDLIAFERKSENENGWEKEAASI